MSVEIRRGRYRVPATQAAIDVVMLDQGQDLGPGDQVRVVEPEHGAYLPDTPAVVTVCGGSVCRTPDDSCGRFQVRDGARLIARGRAETTVHRGSSVDVHDDATADLRDGAAACLYGSGGRVQACSGSTVYAWAGSVRADKGATVWLMSRDASVDAVPGAAVRDGRESAVSRQAASQLAEDVFERHRLNAENGAYDREPFYTGDRW